MATKKDIVKQIFLLLDNVTFQVAPITDVEEYKRQLCENLKTLDFSMIDGFVSSHTPSYIPKTKIRQFFWEKLLKSSEFYRVTEDSYETQNGITYYDMHTILDKATLIVSKKLRGTL